jgi:hypothetical protein
MQKHQRSSLLISSSEAEEAPWELFLDQQEQEAEELSSLFCQHHRDETGLGRVADHYCHDCQQAICKECMNGGSSLASSLSSPSLLLSLNTVASLSPPPIPHAHASAVPPLPSPNAPSGVPSSSFLSHASHHTEPLLNFLTRSRHNLYQHILTTLSRYQLIERTITFARLSLSSPSSESQPGSSPSLGAKPLSLLSAEFDEISHSLSAHFNHLQSHLEQRRLSLLNSANAFVTSRYD